MGRVQSNQANKSERVCYVYTNFTEENSVKIKQTNNALFCIKSILINNTLWAFMAFFRWTLLYRKTRSENYLLFWLGSVVTKRKTIFTHGSDTENTCNHFSKRKMSKNITHSFRRIVLAVLKVNGFFRELDKIRKFQNTSNNTKLSWINVTSQKSFLIPL